MSLYSSQWEKRMRYLSGEAREFWGGWVLSEILGLQSARLDQRRSPFIFTRGIAITFSLM